ncbi:MAG: dihydrolipoyl dehydrogenase [Thermoanaerobaculia bacterium]|nr:dihydrolipoyl dehydrogenase [Thermoanaerobaculia bacterium]
MGVLELVVPDLGDADDVDVVEVLVRAGETVEKNQSLVTLESDKASMEVPSDAAGTLTEVRVQVGDKVQSGQVIAILQTEEPTGDVATNSREAEGVTEPAPTQATHRAPEAPDRPAQAPKPSHREAAEADLRCDLVVLGAGPGGYTAAFRAADLGLDVILVERYPSLGGVCLNVGCIPSKALLHMAKLVDDAAAFADHGVTFGAPTIDLDKLRGWKDGVVSKLTGGLAQMAKARGVRTVTGTGTFTGTHRLKVTIDEGETSISFRHAIVAAGSRPVQVPGFPYDDPRMVDSTGALELRDVPKRMLVLGGGIIGLEMATVYHALGSEITVVELMDSIMPGTDRDLVRPLRKRLDQRYAAIWTSTKVTGIKAQENGLLVSFEGEHAPETDKLYDLVLYSVGRRPNGGDLGAEAAGLTVDAKGFIPVDGQMRSNVQHIFAIGDIVGQPMLAHKAIHEGRVAAEVAAGLRSHFDARVIPSVAYTDPEVAWVGLTETAAKEEGIAYEKGVFPWSASGRSLAQGRGDGSTKLLFDPGTERVLGGGIVGPHAGDLIAEVALAIEMGAVASDIGLTIHPHPTLSETVALSAEAFEGTITDLYLPKQKKAKKAREDRP